MIRTDIISTIGRKYLQSNIENGEFSYVKALKNVGKNIRDFQYNTEGTHHQNIDIRFENDRLVVLVECKNKFSKWDTNEIQRQLQDYVRFEKEYSEKRIVAILAETEGDEVWTWYGGSVIIDEQHRKLKEKTIKNIINCLLESDIIIETTVYSRNQNRLDNCITKRQERDTESIS